MIRHDVRDVARIARFAENDQGMRQGRNRIHARYDDHRDAACEWVRGKIVDNRRPADGWKIQVEQDQRRWVLID